MTLPKNIQNSYTYLSSPKSHVRRGESYSCLCISQLDVYLMPSAAREKNP